MYWQNIQCFVYTCPQVGGAAATNTKGTTRWILPNTDTQDAHTRMILWESEGMTKLSETCSSPSSSFSSSSHVSLSSCLAHTHTHLSASSALRPHTPACAAGGVSRFSDEATSDQWAAVRTVRERGENSPPIALRSTWEPALPQGGAAQPPALWMNTKQKTLTNRWVTRVTVGFSPVRSF